MWEGLTLYNVKSITLSKSHCCGRLGFEPATLSELYIHIVHLACLVLSGRRPGYIRNLPVFHGSKLGRLILWSLSWRPSSILHVLAGWVWQVTHPLSWSGECGWSLTLPHAGLPIHEHSQCEMGAVKVNRRFWSCQAGERRKDKRRINQVVGIHLCDFLFGSKCTPKIKLIYLFWF